MSQVLSSENASTSSSLDLLLSLRITSLFHTHNAAHELGLHDNRSVNVTSAQKLEHSVLSQINHRGLRGVLRSLLLHLLGNQTPHLIQIHRRAIVRLAVQMEVSHTDLSEVSRMARNVTSSHTTRTTYRKGYGRAADLRPYHVQKDGNDAFLFVTPSHKHATNTTVASTDVSSGLSVLMETSRLPKRLDCSPWRRKPATTQSMVAVPITNGTTTPYHLVVTVKSTMNENEERSNNRGLTRIE